TLFLSIEKGIFYIVSIEIALFSLVQELYVPASHSFLFVNINKTKRGQTKHTLFDQVIYFIKQRSDWFNKISNVLFYMCIKTCFELLYTSIFSIFTEISSYAIKVITLDIMRLRKLDHFPLQSIGTHICIVFRVRAA